MQTVELAVAQSRFAELVASLSPGGEIAIEQDHLVVALLVSPHPALGLTKPPTRSVRSLKTFHPLPLAEQNQLKMHDREWCEPLE